MRPQWINYFGNILKSHFYMLFSKNYSWWSIFLSHLPSAQLPWRRGSRWMMRCAVSSTPPIYALGCGICLEGRHMCNHQTGLLESVIASSSPATRTIRGLWCCSLLFQIWSPSAACLWWGGRNSSIVLIFAVTWTGYKYPRVFLELGKRIVLEGFWLYLRTAVGQRLSFPWIHLWFLV